MTDVCRKESLWTNSLVFQGLAMECILSSVGFYLVLMIFLWNYHKRIYFQPSWKVLFFSKLLVYSVMASLVLFNYAWYFLQEYVWTSECDMMFPFCTEFMEFHQACLLLTTLINISIFFERCWAATLHSPRNKNLNRCLGIAFIVLSMAVSMVTVHFIMTWENVDHFAPTCLSFTRSIQINNYNASQLVLNSLACFATYLLPQGIKDRKSNKEMGNLTKRYKRTTVLSATELASRLMVPQVFLLFVIFCLILCLHHYEDNRDVFTVAGSVISTISHNLPLLQIISAHFFVKRFFERKTEKKDEIVVANIRAVQEYEIKFDDIGSARPNRTISQPRQSGSRFINKVNPCASTNSG